MKFVHNLNGPDGREAVVLYDPLLREYHVRLMVDSVCIGRCYFATVDDALRTAEELIKLPE